MKQRTTAGKKTLVREIANEAAWCLRAAHRRSALQDLSGAVEMRTASIHLARAARLVARHLDLLHS